MSAIINLFKKGDDINHIRKQTIIPRLTKEDSFVYIENFEEANTNINKESTKMSEQNYLKIDQKNNFKFIDKESINYLDYKYEQYKENETTKFDNTNIIMNNILDKICNSSVTDDIFTISLNISKQNPKSNKLSKDCIDNLVNRLLGNNKINLYKNKIMTLNKENCETIGSILCYSYLRLQQLYKIKDLNRLLEIRNNILSRDIDVQKDFLNYCKKNKNSDEKLKITYYWKKNRNSYECLPELIFLINRYSHVSVIEIDIDLFDKNLSEEMTKFIEITLLNIHLIFNSLKSFKINFINEMLQNGLYSFYKNRFDIIFSNAHESIKFNNYMIKDDIFQKKWNFKDYFKLEEHRRVENEKMYNLHHISHLKTNLYESIDFKNDDSISVAPHAPKRLMTLANLGNIHQNNDNATTRNNEYKTSKKNKSLYDITLERYANIFEILIMTLFCLNNTNKTINLEIIMNDSYTIEFLYQFKNYYGIEGFTRNSENFNIFDILLYNNIMKYINKFNIEINSLDTVSFEKILNFLYYNESLTSFYMSFFSSDITYFPQVLYKLCRGYFDDDKLLENIDSSDYFFDDIINIEDKLINKLSLNFKNNLLVLFDIIQKIKILNELGLNFDIPKNISNKPFFMNTILKFILNILYYASNSKKITKLCLLSPNSSFNSKLNPNINNIINSINITNAPLLTDLSIHFQFYHIKDINNFINTKLIILNIGDLDIYTFKILCNNILSKDFNTNSCLENLSIGLLKSITDFDIELKFLLRKLFHIKIKNLISLSLYSNICISDEIEYNILLKMLDNNWISEYTIYLNNNSEKYMKNFSQDIKKLRFFISHNLEGKLLESEDIMKLQNNPLTLEIDKNKDRYDESFWCLKYIFEKVHVDEFKSEQRNKDIIMGILKYLYFLKIPKIVHPIFQSE